MHTSDNPRPTIKDNRVQGKAKAKRFDPAPAGSDFVMGDAKKVYTSKSDGIYIGLSGQTKRTWEIIHGQPIGVVLAAFGQFLAEEYKSIYHTEREQEMKDALKEEFAKHGHSGGSELVEIQQLFDLLGARCLDDNTRAYLLDLEEWKPSP